jgi:N-acetylglucosaminyl-diphospho-decaprenol L-rhamnosyltransferase
MRISVVIPNKNGAGMIGHCVEAAIASGAAEVIVVDDGSSDTSPAEAESAGAELLQSPGHGFSAAVNTGARRATGEALLILNSDCFLEHDTLGRLAESLVADPRLGVCAAALVEPDRSPGKSHGRSLTLGLAIRTALSANPDAPPRLSHGIEEVEFVPLACAALRRSAWDVVSGLDERFLFYFEDQDVCRRLRSVGWRIAVNWDAIAVHMGGASSSSRDEQRWFVQYVRSRTRYLRKHYRFSWPLFVAVWVPAALARSAIWMVRPGSASKRWARAWLTATGAGISG